jgi:hypothetical protein
MRKLLPLVMILMATPASAGGLVTKHASSVQLTVDAARSTAIRIGDTYSASGTNITAGTMGGVSTGAGTYTVTTASDPWSLSESYTQKDTIPTTAVTTGDTPNFSNITSYTAGTAGSLAGTIDSTHAMSLTAGGAGSSATGQFVSEITVID